MRLFLSCFYTFFVLFGNDRIFVTFNTLSVISRRNLDATGSSKPTFRELPHGNIMPQTHDMIFHSDILC